MARTFLPPLKPNGGLALPAVQSSHFLDGTDDLIDQVRTNMVVPEANSECRTPSPFARVWQFRRSLQGSAGAQEQARAIATFRGITALFALRNAAHLKVMVDVTPRLTREKGTRSPDTPVTTLFQVHTSCLPEDHSRQTARFLFEDRVVLFSLAEPDGRTSTVFAGYSPLTLFFPAARTLEASSAIKAVHWYDQTARRWRDPTDLSGDNPRRLPQEDRQSIAAWLDASLARDASKHGLEIFAGEGLAPADDEFLSTLLAQWREELILGKVPGRVFDQPLAKTEALLGAQRSHGDEFKVPRLLSQVVELGVTPSDFAQGKDGTLLLTLEEAEQPNYRLYRNLFGSPEYRRLLEAAPAEGPDLGTVLGRAGEAPVSYVVLNKLFYPTLGRIEEGGNALARGWSALRLNAPPTEAIYLYPFHPIILRHFTPTQLRENTVVQKDIGAVRVAFRHRPDAPPLGYSYEPGTVKPLDPSMDLRFFPNFRLDSLADAERQLPNPQTDRYYHARLRLSPELDRLKMGWFGGDGIVLPDQGAYTTGDFTRPADRSLLAQGKQAFWRLPLTTTPEAFYVEGHGFLLLELDDLGHMNQSPRPWTAALDFGTTNSCVAIDRGSGEAVTGFRLPVLTTTLLTQATTGLRGESDEGYSALADFFFWQNAATSNLNDEEFFPTQVLTRLALTTRELPSPNGFNERNGLAFFPNVGLTSVENPGFLDLIEGFGSLRGSESKVKPRFHLNRRLKWKDENGTQGNSQLWRRVFHQHLRLQLLLTAAKENAYIARLIASYPKAFVPEERSGYLNELQAVWNGGERLGANTDVELRSESAAAAIGLEIKRGQEFFLLDVGGGTTDIAVFEANILEEECSLPMAGNVLERYVCQSAELREQIVRCFEDNKIASSMIRAFSVRNQPEMVYQTLFQGMMLKSEGAKSLAKLRNVGQKDRATQGFFLSAIFLYTGLAYFCGLRLAARRRDREGIGAEEHLQWLGNGSSFIRMLGIGEQSFEQVLVKMFGDARVAPLRSDAKTIVARGLLKAPPERSEGTLGGFARLLSNSVTLDGRAWQDTDTLHEFYQHYGTGRPMSWSGVEEGKTFHGFLTALQTHLPSAVFNQSALVDTSVLKPKRAQSWAFDYVTAHHGKIAIKLKERIGENHAHWEGVISSGAEENLYVEPLFVSELAALLAQVREDFAGTADR